MCDRSTVFLRGTQRRKHTPAGTLIRKLQYENHAKLAVICYNCLEATTKKLQLTETTTYRNYKGHMLLEIARDGRLMNGHVVR
jgi:hypothetical protein